jgi:hypothetical protein
MFNFVGMNIADALMFTLPGAITGATAYLLINKYLKEQSRKDAMALRREAMKVTTPVRLQAYERVILLLERIEPSSAVNRLVTPNKSSKQMQLDLIRTIQEEYNHNIVQQIYMSGEAWELVKKAKDDAIKLITLAGRKTKDDDSAYQFSKTLIEVQSEEELYTSKHAIESLKREVRRMF